MLKCVLCKKTFSHSSNLDAHMVTHTKEKPHKCQICSRAFGLEGTLKKHIQIHDGVGRTRNKNHLCTVCSYKCIDKGTLERHLRKHFAERQFSCPITDCGFKTKYKFSLSRHVLQAHSDKRPFKCPSDGCSYKSKRRADIRDHLKIHSNVKNFVCTVLGCNYTCNFRSNLRVHTSRVHSNERPFKCLVCDFRAKVKNHLTMHQAMHKKIKRFQCQAPNCTFASHQRSNLKKHFDCKHRANEVLCTEPGCNFKCGSAALLNRHLKQHRLLILKCPGDSCGFRTKYKHNLLEHISYRHKEFQSSVTVAGTRISDLKAVGTMNTLHCRFTGCNFQTKFRQQYDRHVDTHEKKEKGQHVCSFCFSRFSRPCLLKDHVQTHIREKPFSCSHCYYRTTQSFQLRSHARKIHQIHVIPRGQDDQVRKCRTCGRNCFSYGESVLHSMSHLQPVVVLKQLKLHVL